MQISTTVRLTLFKFTGEIEDSTDEVKNRRLGRYLRYIKPKYAQNDADCTISALLVSDVFMCAEASISTL